MQISTSPQIPPVSKIAFWDVDFQSIDFEKRSLFVMEKVMNFGVWADVLALFQFYGRARIRREIIGASHLKKTALSWLCLVLDLNETDFRCFTKTPSNLTPWIR